MGATKRHPARNRSPRCPRIGRRCGRGRRWQSGQGPCRRSCGTPVGGTPVGGTPVGGTLAAAIASGGAAAGEFAALTAPPPAPACTCPGGAPIPVSDGFGGGAVGMPATGQPAPVPAAVHSLPDLRATSEVPVQRRRDAARVLPEQPAPSPPARCFREAVAEALAEAAPGPSAISVPLPAPAEPHSPRRTIPAMRTATTDPSAASLQPDAEHSPDRRSVPLEICSSAAMSGASGSPAPKPDWDTARFAPGGGSCWREIAPPLARMEPVRRIERSARRQQHQPGQRNATQRRGLVPLVAICGGHYFAPPSHSSTWISGPAPAHSPPIDG